MARTIGVLCACVLMLPAIAAEERAAGNVTLPRFPSISPDGATVVFSWRGDLWRVPAAGGRAARLTAHPFNDAQSAWSRDGRRIAFVSDRNGPAGIFLMNADGTGLRPVTAIDRPVGLAAFGTDEAGKEVITLTATVEPEGFLLPRPFMISPEGGDLARVHGAAGLFPVVSPDGSKVLFERGNSSWSRSGYRGSANRDVWLYDRRAGTFARLTSWEGNDGRARWASDDTIVFASDRGGEKGGKVNLYRLKLGQDESRAEALTRLTEVDVEDFDVSADGRTVVFSAWDSLYTLDLTRVGAGPVRLTIHADEDEQDNVALKDVSRSVTEAALSPDGKTMAFVAYGEVYVRGTEGKPVARRVTETAAREKHLAWSPDGSTLYFTGELSGREAIYAARVRLTRADVKREVQAWRGRADRDGDGDEDKDKEDADDAPAARTQPATQPATRTTATTTATTTTRTATRPAARQAARSASEASRWPDAIAFTVEPFLSSETHNLSMPSPSPDGKALAFRRGNGELMIKELPDGPTRRLVDGWSTALHWRWSPTGAYIAYVTEDENHNADVFVVRADGSAPAVNVTRHPANDHSPRWSADGKVLAFLSERVNREYDAWVVALDKDLEALSPQELDAYYKSAAAAAKKRGPLTPTTRSASATTTTRPAATVPATTQATAAATTAPATVPATVPAAAPAASAGGGERVVASGVTIEPRKSLDLEDAYLRVRRVTSLAGSEAELELLPAGNQVVFTATVGTDRATWLADVEGSSPPRRLGVMVNAQHLSLPGDALVVVVDGRGGLMKLPGGEIEFHDVRDTIRLDLREQNVAKFVEAARIVGARFHDPNLAGLDWPTVTARYLKLVEQARTANEFDHVAARFVGQLNGSHLGINAPDPTSPTFRPAGRLGARTERVRLTELSHGYRVTSVLPEGPAGKGPMKLEGGDVITAIDLEPFDAPARTLDAALAGKVGKETIVTVRRGGRDARGEGGEGGRELHLLITPISFDRWASLSYHQWRLDTARKVAEWSDGKVGYIHIQGMNQPSLDVFERDLFAAANGKKGLIIDVRNNGGGWTTDRLLASIMAPDHAYTVTRGMPAGAKGYPNDRLFIARYTLPINLVCNERSFSNAEIVSHAFKTMRRGTLVGQRTAGGVISTGGTTLIDGTGVRIPFRAWFTRDGLPQENTGAVPDLLVEQTPEDEAAGRDPQLRAAVEDLLKRL